MIGIGIDIESVKRFKLSYKNQKFLDMIFTKREIEYCRKRKEPYISFAGKFCAKEAIIKAYPKKISIKNVEIVNSKSGKLNILINGKINKHVHCSISHTNEYAAAAAVVENL